MKKQFLLLLALPWLLSSCAFLADEATTPREIVQVTCAESRLESSFTFHSKAKEFLANFYKTRKESELFFAWYASEDSDYMARAISRCWDRKNKHYYAVQNMLHKNKILQKLVAQNMRQDNQTELSELFLDEYRKIFVRDIQ